MAQENNVRKRVRIIKGMCIIWAVLCIVYYCIACWLFRETPTRRLILPQLKQRLETTTDIEISRDIGKAFIRIVTRDKKTLDTALGLQSDLALFSCLVSLAILLTALRINGAHEAALKTTNKQ